MTPSKRDSQLLRLLSSTSDEQLSGEVLSKTLGISRVAVWKQIQSLKNSAYEIESTPKGYRLLQSDDVPHPWEMGKWKEQIHYFPSLDSTMITAKEMAKSDCIPFTTVTAGRQTGGKGRLGRQWQSDCGGLYLTTIIRPDLPPHLTHKITFTAAITLVQVLKKKFDIKASIKWPNDILVDGKKIAGILSEMSVEADQIRYLNIGVGLNVHNSISDQQFEAVSIKDLHPQSISRKEILADYLTRFSQNLDSLSIPQVINLWKENTSTLGRKVSVKTVSDVVEGEAIDIDQNGCLVIKTKNQSIKTIYHGDCFHN